MSDWAPPNLLHSDGVLLRMCLLLCWHDKAYSISTRPNGADEVLVASVGLFIILFILGVYCDRQRLLANATWIVRISE